MPRTTAFQLKRIEGKSDDEIYTEVANAMSTGAEGALEYWTEFQGALGEVAERLLEDEHRVYVAYGRLLEAYRSGDEHQIAASDASFSFAVAKSLGFCRAFADGAKTYALQ
jgi:hypothetical protein